MGQLINNQSNTDWLLLYILNCAHFMRVYPLAILLIRVNEWYVLLSYSASLYNKSL